MLLITEPLRACIELATLTPSWKLIKHFNSSSKNDALVVTIPGFCGADGSMFYLRKYLSSLGHTCYGWNQGRNWGFHEAVEDKLEKHLEKVVTEHRQPARLIGHSLGGVYAREIAKRRPDLVSQVFTLGSPFNEFNIGSDSVAPIVKVIYELINGEISKNERIILDQIRHPPPCQTHCLYSRADGVVDYRICLQENPPVNVENIEVIGSHVGMGHNALVLYLIGQRIQTFNSFNVE